MASALLENERYMTAARWPGKRANRLIRLIKPVGVGCRRGSLAVDVGEIVGDAVDLVEQTLPLLRPVGMFRHDRLLKLVEPGR
jgi:hypothetical protein